MGRSIFSRALTGVARHLVLPWYAKRFQHFHDSLSASHAMQHKLLLEWLKRCQGSQFGRDHGFASIQSIDDYQQRVPVARYDYFAPYINEVARGNHTALFPAEERVERFTITTGSTGVPKLNPVTPTWLRHYRRGWDLWGGKMLVDHLPIFGKKILHIIGSWDMGRTEGNIPISMVSALLARYQHPLVRPYYAVPNNVTDIRDPVARYYATLRMSVGEDIGLIVVMNPGTLLRLAQLAHENRESLIRDIYDGTLSSRFDVPMPIRNQIAHRIKRDPRRARELESIVERTGRLYPSDYWGQPLIACWLGGTAGYQSRYLSEYFGTSPMRDQGLVSSEGRHTLPIEDGKPEGVLSVDSGFYEFIPAEEGNAKNPTTLEAHELQPGCDYHLVMTTFSGYFRFHIGDLVRCKHFIGQAPIIEFLQKGDRCGDLEGEKVTEHQFLEAATTAAKEQGIRLGPVTAVPTRPSQKLPCYQIIVEHGDVPNPDDARKFLQTVDQQLRTSNFLYSARRRERVLGPPTLWRIHTGAWSQYMQSEINRRGTGDVHYKHPALVQDCAILEQLEPVDQVELATD